MGITMRSLLIAVLVVLVTFSVSQSDQATRDAVQELKDKEAVFGATPLDAELRSVRAQAQVLTELVGKTSKDVATLCEKNAKVDPKGTSKLSPCKKAALQLDARAVRKDKIPSVSKKTETKEEKKRQAKADKAAAKEMLAEMNKEKAVRKEIQATPTE